MEFKADKSANLHIPAGKASFQPDKLYENIIEFYREIVKMKPAAVKGTYIKSFYLSSTMGPGVQVDISDLQQVIQ